MNRRVLIVAGAGFVLAVGAWLAFGYFGVQYLFIDEKVDEARPTFATGETSTAPTGVTEEPAQTPASGTLAMGTFVDRSHPTEGTALVLADGEGRRVLRFEGFETDNGPDLNVYLSPAPADADAGRFDDDYVDLGDLKGNVGDQNYEIPPGTDLDRYSTVVIWCVRFEVAFGTAGLDLA